MTTLIKFIISLLLVIASTNVFSQSYTAKVKDAETGESIPFATIQFTLNSGTITNEEGIFTIQEKDIKKITDSVYISSMGYEEKGIWLPTQRDTIIHLASKAFELKGVFLTDNPLSVEEIIDNVSENLDKNYDVNTLSRKRVFLRHSIISAMKKINLDFKESTIDEFDEKFMDSVSKLIPRNSDFYQEMVGDVYGNYGENKLVVDKAAELYDKSKNLSIEGVNETIERVFKENVKPDSYLKFKSGLFSTKIEVDSLLQANEDADKVAEKVEESDNKWSFTKQMKRQITSIYKELLFNEDSKLDILRKSSRYEFTKDDFTYIDDEPVYIIHFEPKRSKDFKGTLYINTEDFAIVRADFTNVRPLYKFGLLGITYRENVYQGSMLFKKDDNGKYSPKYIDLKKGNYFAVDRPVKIIEKNKHVKGRRKQNELSFQVDISGTQIDKYELVVFNAEDISSNVYEGTVENEKAEATYLPKYDPNFWDGHTIIEPNAAIRSFEIVE